jgi:signal peptidase II
LTLPARLDRSFWLSVGLAALAFGLDRAHKFVQVGLMHWPSGRFVRVTPFFDIGLVWNPGISYGLFSTLPVWALGAIMVAAVVALAVWWWRTDSALIRAGLGLAIGGALSNGLDRGLYGAVADFFHFHAFGYSFYIFNLADTAITIGVVLLFFDLMRDARAGRARS